MNLIVVTNLSHICEKEFNEYYNEDKLNKIKIKDFCYYSGDYRGPAHIKCSSMCLQELS